jgi:hypothetical protein
MCSSRTDLGLSSIKPDDGGYQVNSAEEISGRFVIACGDGPVLFKLAVEILDEMARFIHLYTSLCRNLV